MNSRDWPKLKVADLCESIDYGYTASATYTPTGPRFLRITDIASGHIDWNDVPFCEISVKDKPKFKLNSGDIVIARTGATTGASAYISETPDAVFASYLVRLKIGNKANPQFLAYFLKSPQYWSYVQGVLGDKSAQPNASAKTLTQASLSLPPLDQQRAIARILGSLDNKIELNRRTNETLQAMAHSTFKSWFVDFDPVHAKAEGRLPAGMDADTAALFPSSFEDFPLGKLPKGWRDGRLDEMILLQRGFDLPTSTRTPGPYPVLSASGPSGTHAEFRVKGPGITTGRSGLLGKVFFVHQDFWPLNTSLWVKEFRRAGPLYTYHLLRDLNFDAFNAGSAVPTLNRNHVLGLLVVIPPAGVVNEFESLAALLFNRSHQSEQESDTLAMVRDALLPKLISGEIRIKDAEQIVGEHV